MKNPSSKITDTVAFAGTGLSYILENAQSISYNYRLSYNCLKG